MSDERTAGRSIGDKMLNAQIAEKFFGYEWRVSSTSGRRCIYLPEDAPGWMDQRATGREPLVRDWESGEWTPDYSGDMTAAFLVADELAKRDVFLMLIDRRQEPGLPASVRTWEALFQTRVQTIGEGLCDRAPEAICEAALEALDSLECEAVAAAVAADSATPPVLAPATPKED